MFREIKVSKQPEDGRKRRWYQGEHFELFVWYVKHEQFSEPARRREFVNMQLCYVQFGRQRVLEWSKQRGFRHHRVDKSSDSLVDHGAGGTELVAGGALDVDWVLPHFMREAGTLPVLVRDFVLETLALYARAARE